MVENALANPRILEKKKKDFWEWYTLQYMNHWSSMIRQFDHGAKTLQTWARKRNMATLMTTDRNPYFRLIEKVADETSWIDVSQRSAALAFVAELNAVIKLARSESQKEKGTLLAKLAGEKEQLSQKIRTGAEKGDGDINVMEKRFATAKIWKDYTDSLEKLSSVVISQETAFRTASDFFTPPADTSQQSNAFIYLAYSHCLKLTCLIQVKGDMTEVRRIVMGPITYLLQYCLADTACYLQRRWENQVLGGLQGAPQDKIAPLLFDPSGGSVWKYIEGPAKPSSPRESGLCAATGFPGERERSFRPLYTGFSGISQHRGRGRHRSSAGIPGPSGDLPIAVNDGAVLHPHANLLTLQCSDGQTTLKNFNYPQKSSFRWLPDKCSDTTLSILFPDLTLTRVYRGKWGFPQFLTDFKDGNRTFTPEDFPEARAKLKRLNVSAIRLSYKINGARPIVQALKKAPSKAPQEIVPCIDH
jgi:type VI secretion system protein ImpL